MKINLKNLMIFSGSVLAITAIPIAGIVVQASSKSATTNNQARKFRFAFIKSTDNSTYDERLFKFAEQTANNLKIAIDKSSSQNDANAEQTNITVIINSGKYDGVIFQPVNTEGSFNNLKLLLDAKLYVSIPDRTFVDAKIDTLTAEQKKYLVMQVTSDNVQIAKDAAETLTDYLLRKDPNAFNSQKKILFMEGETASSSSIERKTGAQSYFTEDQANRQGFKKTTQSRGTEVDFAIATGDWNIAVAQSKWEALYNAGKPNVGIGAIAANDQMASGIQKSSQNTLGNLADYPIVTVDASKIYKEEIAYDASRDKAKRVIANFAQRTATTMKAIVYSLYSACLYKLASTNSFYEHAYKAVVKQGVPFVEDDKTTSADDDGVVPLPDLGATFVTEDRTFRLAGIKITRGQDGNLINEQWLVD